MIGGDRGQYRNYTPASSYIILINMCNISYNYHIHLILNNKPASEYKNDDNNVYNIYFYSLLGRRIIIEKKNNNTVVL